MAAFIDHKYQSCVLSKRAVANASALLVKRVTFFRIILAVSNGALQPVWQDIA